MTEHSRGPPNHDPRQHDGSKAAQRCNQSILITTPWVMESRLRPAVWTKVDTEGRRYRSSSTPLANRERWGARINGNTVTRKHSESTKTTAKQGQDAWFPPN
ncbi:hypothetical protein L209DRAFT_561788 [Thermothelomyces heterothallicus CBS 203.75]